jgi:hypothetical protein
VVGYEDGFAALVEDFEGFDDDAVCGPLRIFAQLFDRDADMDGVVEEDGLDEAETIVAIAHGAGIDGSGCHADCDAEDQSSMGHALAEGLGAAPLGVHVMRIEVAGLARMQDYIGFCDGSADGFAACAGDKVFEKHFGCHGGSLATRRGFRSSEYARSIIPEQTYHPDRMMRVVQYHHRDD